MDITLLGTGNAFTTEVYNTCFILKDSNGNFLVDAGGGNTIMRQLKHTGTDWKKVNDIFVTHTHIDHIIGMVWLSRLICQKSREKTFDGVVRVYGHDEVIKTIYDLAKMLLLEKDFKFVGKSLQLIPVTDRETVKICSHDVTFFDIHSTKTKQFGFALDGKKLVCCGDEPCNESIKDLARDAEWLMHEAFCLYSQADIFKPYEKHHSTVKDACELATELNVKNIILYHTEEKNIKNRKELYLEEGRHYFNGNIFVPEDLETISI